MRVPQLAALCLLLTCLPSQWHYTDARKSKKKAARLHRQSHGGAGLGPPLATWTQRPLGPPSSAGVREVLRAWVGRPEAAGSSATVEELRKLQHALSTPWGAGSTDSQWRAVADAWMARARQAAPTETVPFAMAASFLIDGISMGARAGGALDECLQWYSVVIEAGEEGQRLPMYEVSLTRYAFLLSQQVRVKENGGASATEVAALRERADTVYRTLINAGARMPRRQVAQIRADYAFMLLEWSLSGGGGPRSLALGGSSAADITPSLHRAASLLHSARPGLTDDGQSSAFVSYGLALLWSFTGHWVAAAEAVEDSLTASRSSHADENSDSLDALRTDEHVCTLAVQLLAGLNMLVASRGFNHSLQRDLRAVASDAGCRLQSVDDASAVDLPRLLDGWTVQDLADPLLDVFAAPRDPINPLYPLLYQADIASVQQTLREDTGLARLPGPTGSTALTAVFYRIVEKQISVQGMYWACQQWDLTVEAKLLELLIDAGADLWAADNYGLTPAYIAIAGSGCTQCLEAFHQAGMVLDDLHLKMLYPGASRDVVFRILREMATRSMVLASTLLRHGNRDSLLASISGSCKHLSAAIDDSLLRKDTVTSDELQAIETTWRAQWFSKLLRMQLNPNLSSEKGETLLACAAQNGFIEIVQLLLDAGADVNAVSTTDGSTALHMAAGGGYENIVKVLLQHSANIDAKDSSGRKPVDTVPVPMKHLKSLLGGDDPVPANGQPTVDETTRVQLVPDEWSTEVATDLVTHDLACAIDVESAENFTITRFIERYYQRKPVVVRAAALGDHGPFFSPSEFSAHFGKHLVKASVLPYGETYGVESRRVTIDDFFRDSGMVAEKSSAPDKSSNTRKPEYIFDDEILKRKPKLLEDLRAKAPVAATKAVSHACNNVKQQLIVGPPRSAAHMHYHQDACVSKAISHFESDLKSCMQQSKVKAPCVLRLLTKGL